MTIDDVVEQFPVTREQVKAALEFAARSLDASVRRPLMRVLFDDSTPRGVASALPRSHRRGSPLPWLGYPPKRRAAGRRGSRRIRCVPHHRSEHPAPAESDRAKNSGCRSWRGPMEAHQEHASRDCRGRGRSCANTRNLTLWDPSARVPETAAAAAGLPRRRDVRWKSILIEPPQPPPDDRNDEGPVAGRPVNGICVISPPDRRGGSAQPQHSTA